MPSHVINYKADHVCPVEDALMREEQEPHLSHSGTPRVVDVQEFLEITRDFTDPREAIREAIANALDYRASEISVTVSEDASTPYNELILEISDDGIGLNEERMKAFFDLGNSTVGENLGLPRRIGYKGHGTKTYYNSRRIELESNASDMTVKAAMDEPLQNLMKRIVPKYRYEILRKHNKKTGTKITIRGYNQNHNVKDFGHAVLKDYVLWFTRFGSVEREFDIQFYRNKKLHLKGLGSDEPELLQFGHRFPSQNHDIQLLRRERPADWTKVFVKRWIFGGRPIKENPGKTLDVVFYIEGDEAKHDYNPMIRRRGKPKEHGMYKVEERYGLWVCRDFIPIKRYNDWLGLRKHLETKYHAFVNCQEFRLTANRGDIGNTPPDLLNAIEATVQQIYENEIIGSSDYQEYEANAELEEQYSTATQEGNDYTRRRKRALSKRVCTYLRCGTNRT